MTRAAKPAILFGAPVPSFKRPSDVKLDSVVLHDAVACTYKGVVQASWKRAKAGSPQGVAYTIDDGGQIRLHHAPHHFARHTGIKQEPIGLDMRSVGVEVTNVADPRRKPARGQRVVAAPWAPELGGKFIWPNLAQMEAAYELVAWLIADQGVVDHFPGALSKRKWAWRKLKTGRGPGVWSHAHYGGHLDGSPTALYVWLRHVHGMVPRRAYATSVSMSAAASSTKGQWASNIPILGPGGWALVGVLGGIALGAWWLQ